jgi:hypothetical protein
MQCKLVLHCGMLCHSCTVNSRLMVALQSL